MYERTYGTDWETLSKDEGVERAFALGVAAALDDPNPKEFERIMDHSDTSYDRSLIELAFREGKRKAQGKREQETDSTDVWNVLVESDEEKTTVRADDRLEGGRDVPPGALRSLDLLESHHDKDLQKQELPDFLKK